MPILTAATNLSFGTGAQALIGDGDTSLLSYTSGDLMVLRKDTDFTLIDKDFGPLGALTAKLRIDLAVGLEFNASLGLIPNYETGMDVQVNAQYEPFLLASDIAAGLTKFGTTVDGEQFARFDFSDFEITSITSSSAGLGAQGTFTDVLGEEAPAPRGVELNAVAGLSVSLEDVYYRFPLSLSGEEVDDIELLTLEEFKIPIFQFNESSQKITFDLGDFFDLDLRLPTGTSTDASLSGTTLVGEKGFASEAFIELIGDFDLMLTRALKNLPGIGQVAALAEETIFFDEEVDLGDEIEFIEKDLLTLGFTMVDLSGKVALVITEELFVDYAASGGADTFNLFSGSDFTDDFNSIFLPTEDNGTNAGTGKTPDVNIILVSDNGTPDDVTDDRVVEAELGDADVLVPLPFLDTAAGDVARKIQVDAFYDIDQAEVSYEVGIGGRFKADLTVLKGYVGGHLGTPLGIALGPAFTTSFPEGGVNFSLFDVFEKRFTIQGGSYDVPSTGVLSEASSDDTRLEQLGYEAGDFGDSPSEETYSILYTAVLPEGFDPDASDALAQLEAFGIAVGKRVRAAQEVMEDFLPASGVTTTALLGTTPDLIDDNYRNSARDVDNATSGHLTRQLAIWPSALAGRTSTVELRVEEEDFRNLLIAAPTTDAQDVTEGLGFVHKFRDDLRGGDILDLTTFTTELAPGNITGETLDAMLRSLENGQNVFSQSFEYNIGTQRVVSDSGRGTGSNEFADNSHFQPLAVNVLGTQFDDVIAYTGSTSSNVLPATEAPVYLDGESPENGTDSDLFIGNLGAAHPTFGTVWDIRRQQLEDAKGGSTSVVETTENGVTRSELTVDAFDASTLGFFRPDGSLSHETIVRNMERFVVTFGDQVDQVVTGLGGGNYFDMGDGADILAISVDGKEMDKFNLGAGNDLALLNRTLIEDVDGLTFDVLSGGTGIDEVLIKDDETGALTSQSLLTQGMGWRVTSAENAKAGTFGNVTTTASSSVSALRLASQIAEALGASSAARGTLDQSISLTQTNLAFGSAPVLDIFYAGADSNFVRLGNDIEAISVDAGDESADVVFYAGGSLYSGGTSDADDQPVDLFVADFGDWEAAKTRTIQNDDGTTTTFAPSGVVLRGDRQQSADTVTDNVFAGAIVTEFEQFFVKGSSANDVLVGGDFSDFLDGGDGSDTLTATEGNDTLAGGLGDDVIFVEIGFPSDLSITSDIRDFINGDASDGTSNLFGAGTRVDDDLLIIRPADNIATSTSNRGIAYEVFLDDGNSVEVTFRTDFADAQTVLGSGRSSSKTATANAFLLFYDGALNTPSVFVENVERTNVLGTDAFDDVLIADGGVSYVAGERDNDRDLLLADFTTDRIGVEMVIQDDYDPNEAQGTRLDNGVFVGGIDRMIATFGQGDDTLAGGRLDDFINGGGGDDGLTGEGGKDQLHGGAGDDTIYWEADDSQDTVTGGADTDLLIVSNVQVDGSAVTDAAIEILVDVATQAQTFKQLISADTNARDLLNIAINLADSARTISFGASQSVLYSGIEAVDLVTAGGFDDVLLYQGGNLYLGGEHIGDRDIFVADMRDETTDLVLTTLNPDAGKPQSAGLQDIGNGVFVGEVERLAVALGSGDDIVFGGAYDDVIYTNLGADIVHGSLGDDFIHLGGGNDRIDYFAGDQTLQGGGGEDRLSIGAQQTGYSTLTLAGGPANGVTLYAALGADLATQLATFASKRAELGSFVNLSAAEWDDTFITLSHEHGAVTYKGFEHVTASGDDNRDILVAGSAGAVLSSDGGDDILISGTGDDVMLGGSGIDRYVFGANFGRDTIVGETTGRTEIHLIGLSLTDVVTFNVVDSLLELNFGNNNILVIRDYFAASARPQNFVFFTDDHLDGYILTSNELGNKATTQTLPTPGNEVFGTEADEIFDLVSDGADTFFGFGGNDAFIGSPGPDVFDGSSGRDIVSYEGATEGVSIDLTNAINRAASFDLDDGAFDTGDIFVSIEDVIGSSFRDFLHGNDDDNTLIGLGGGDNVHGFAGDDLIIGGEGADDLTGGEGRDSIYGGAGADFIRAGRFGGSGFGDGFALGEGDDFIDSGDGDDNVEDRFGDNTLIGGAGNDRIFAGSGADTYRYVDGKDEDGEIIEGSGGTDLFHAHDLGFNFEQPDGADSPNSANDAVDFSDFGAAVTIRLSDARATNSAAAAGTVLGTVETADGAYQTTATDSLNGQRRLLDMAGVENATGSVFNDILEGSLLGNVLDGDHGEDTLVGHEGDDTLIGNGGIDMVDYSRETGANGVLVEMNTASRSNPSAEDLIGSATDSHGNADTLVSIEYVVGTAGNDTIFGGDGDDTIAGFGGLDQLFAGTGSDTLDLRRFAEVPDFITFGTGEGAINPDILELAYFGNAEGAGARLESSTATGFENIRLGSATSEIQLLSAEAHTVTYGTGSGTLETGSGNDTVFDGAGSNTITLGAGFDLFVYGGGTDTVHGGDGTDTLDLSAAGRVSIDLTRGRVTSIDSGATLITFTGFESIIGGDDADQITGSSLAEAMRGGDGDDRLFSNAGNDLLEGEAGDDTLRAGAGDDTLSGGAGRDSLVGDGGNDLFLYGDDDLTGDRDTANGAADDDTADFSALSSAIVIDNGLVSGFSELGNKIDLTRLRSVETLVGTDQDDRMERNDTDAADGHIDVFEGGEGDDYAVDHLTLGFLGIEPDFFFNGGPGFDIVDYSGNPNPNDTTTVAGVSVDLSVGRVTYFNAAEFGFTFAQDGRLDLVEGVIGTSQSDSFKGGAEDNYFAGGDGVDNFDGRGGFDIVDFGSDPGVTQGVISMLELSPGVGNGFASDGFGNAEQLLNIEGLIGTRFGDDLSGNIGDNRLEGGDGDDTLSGSDGNDTLVGGQGSDSLSGGSGNDLLVHTGLTLPDTFGDGTGFILETFEQFDGGAGIDRIDFTDASGGIVANIRPINGQTFVLIDLNHDVDPIERADNLQFLGQFTQIEEVLGSAFGDVLGGNDENNILIGGAGNDTMSTGFGEDTLDGGSGFDLLDFSSQPFDGAGVQVDLANQIAIDTLGGQKEITGFEAIQGSGGDDVLVGDDGANVMNGSGGADTLLAGDGIDTLDLSLSDAQSGQIGLAPGLRANEGAVVFLDATGDLTRFPDQPDALFQGGLVRDTFDNQDLIFDFEHVTGSRFNDLIVGDAKNNLLQGMDGDDTLEGGAGRDTLLGGAGADVFVVTENGGDVIIGDFNIAEDQLDLSGFELSAVERAIDLRPRDAELLSDGSVLRFRDGTTLLLAGVGADEFGSVQLILPEDLPPELVALQSGGTLEGGLRAERLFGNAAPDLILGGGGDDELDGGPGDDTLDGGEGRDIVSYFSVTEGAVFVDLEVGLATGGGGSDQLQSIEGVVGSSFGDEINGSGDPDSVDGGAGADILRGGGGADSITTGAGADTVEGSLADLDKDTVTDFSTGDTVKVTGTAFGSQNVKLTKGSAIFEIDANLDGVIDSSFRLAGSFDEAVFLLTTDGQGNTSVEDASDTSNAILLKDGSETFRTTAASAIVDAGAGDDTVTASGDGSILIGGLGDDHLTGGAGAQTLVGGGGSDRMVGGAGADAFVIDASHAAPSTAAVDVIADFQTGVDTLVLTGFGLTSGDQISQTQTASGLELTLNAHQTIQLSGLTAASADAITFAFSPLALPSMTGLSGDIRLSDSGDTYFDSRDSGNTIRGGLGGDKINGAGGNDSIEGQDGADTLIGGDGDDVIKGGATDADLRDVVFAGAGNDSIDGGHGNDELRGDAGNDSIEGGFGADTVIGGDGNDVLTGSALGDVIFGGNGADFINGGFGFDRVNGGAGGDSFFHIGTAGHGSDWIQDFSTAEGDVLVWGGTPASASDFLLQRATTPEAGVDGVQELFVTHIPSGLLAWALVDGDGEDSLLVRSAGTTFDLLA